MESPEIPVRSFSFAKALVFAILAVTAVVVWFFFRHKLNLEYLAQQETVLRDIREAHPFLVYLLAFSIYVLVTGLSVPGATVLSLTYAWYFGFWRGLILISFASTTGATVAFLLSRYLFREFIQRKFGQHLDRFNAALDREGAFYLFTLRLIPAVPFFVINAVMGLTRMSTATFWWVSQIGMLAGTVVFTYAGASIPSLTHLADPSQLRITDVRDWNALHERLSNPNEPISELVRAFPGDIDGLNVLAGSRENRMLIVNAINKRLVNPKYALRTKWSAKLTSAHFQTPTRPNNTDPNNTDPNNTGPNNAEAKRITRVNREILVAVYPDIFSRPQPIMSQRMLLAFFALAIFPFLAKKLMKRLRTQSGRASEPTITG